MSEIMACRACLATDVTLNRTMDLYTQEVYQHLTNIPFQNFDGKPQLFCNECSSHMKRCKDFRDRCLRADGVLNQLILSDVGLTQQSITLFDRNSYRLTSRCSTSQLELISIEKYEIKNENDNEVLLQNYKSQDERFTGIGITKIKSESNNGDDGEHHCDTSQNDNDFLDIKDKSDSEDDVPLVSLSKKCKVEKTEAVKKELKKKNVKQSKVLPGFREDYAKEVILTREQQIEEMNSRSNSKHYLHAPFKCTNCFKGFVDESAFNNHMRKHEKKNGEFECDICRLRYETARQLRAHSFTVHCRKYDCVRCAHRSQTAHQAREHEKWHAGHQYECQLCGQKFSKPTSHLTHMRKRHPTEFACELCGDSFIGRHGLLMHKSKTHRNLDVKAVGPESERFCADCNIVFVNADAWRRHVVTSVKHVLASQNSDVCRVCGSRFATNTELLKHMKEHNGVRAPRPVPPIGRYGCTVCNAQFINQSKLHAHVNRVHLGIKYSKNMVCEVCGKKCTSNATLKYHQRTHTGEKPYPCLECGKKFADSNQLRIHSRTHSGSKPYPCQLCQKKFRQRPALNRHMRVHTGAKPYACPYCAKTFSQSNSLKLHVRTVHLKLPPNNRRNKSHSAFPITPQTAPVINPVDTINA